MLFLIDLGLLTMKTAGYHAVKPTLVRGLSPLQGFFQPFWKAPKPFCSLLAVTDKLPGANSNTLTPTTVHTILTLELPTKQGTLQPKY